MSSITSLRRKTPVVQGNLPGFEEEELVPTFRLEEGVAHPVAGIDEAGRGAWAGPVVAAAVILDRDRLPPGLNDSKALTRQQRETLYEIILATAEVGVGIATVEEIDRVNILQATFLAMARAVDALPRLPAHALVDGNQRPTLPCPLNCVVRGDARSFSIAAASIIAKVYRDKLMAGYAQNHPEYGWERNAGYGTAAHQRALSIVGMSPFHRKSFAPIRKLMTQESPAIS